MLHTSQVRNWKLARAGHVAQLNAAGRVTAAAAGVQYVDMALMSAAFHSPAEYLKVHPRLSFWTHIIFTQKEYHTRRNQT